MEREKAKKASKKVFGSKPESTERIEEGLINETFEVEVDGEAYVVQFSGDLDDSSSIKNNLKFYELFKKTVPVPEVVTEEVQEVKGHDYTIVEKVPGNTAEKNINPEKTRKAGEKLSIIHNKTSFQNEGWMNLREEDKTPEELLEGLKIVGFDKGSLRRRKLDNMYDKKIPILREHSFGELADRIENFLKQYEELFPEDFTAVPVHMDFSPDNILYRKGEITGVIDFDYMYAGLDVRDLVKSANSFWMHEPGAEWNVREKFYEGYRENRELDDEFRTREAYFRIETLARLVASTIELDEMTEDEIEFYRKELEKELQRSKEIIK